MKIKPDMMYKICTTVVNGKTVVAKIAVLDEQRTVIAFNDRVIMTTTTDAQSVVDELTTAGDVVIGENKSSKCVYEMVDTTEDETYFTLGIWDTLDEAIAALDSCKSPTDLDVLSCYDEYVCVEIRERKLGWCSNGKTVYTREWDRVWDEDEDDDVLRIRGK